MDKATKKEFNSLKRALSKIRDVSYRMPDVKKPLKGYFFFIEDIFLFLAGLYFFLIYGMRYLGELLSLFRSLLDSFFSRFVSASILNFYALFSYYLVLLWVILILWPSTVEGKKKVSLNLLRFWAGVTIVFVAVNMVFYNVNGLGGIGDSFEIATNSFARTLNTTLCYMDPNCYMKMKSQKTSSTSSDFYYSFSIEFPRIDTLYYKEGLKIPFDMKLRTSTNVTVIDYNCVFVKGDKVVGNVSYKVDRQVNSFKDKFLLHRVCEIPSNLSSGFYELRVIVDIRANTHCKFPVYVMSSDYFEKVNGIKLSRDINDESEAYLLRSDYKKEILREFPSDPGRSAFVCSNDLISLSTSFSSQMPIFYDIERGPFDLFIDVKKNSFNTLGKIRSLRIKKLWASSGIKFDESEFFNIEKSGDDYVLPSFNSKGSFVIGFELNNLSGDKSLESINLDFSTVYSSKSVFKFYLKKTG